MQNGVETRGLEYLAQGFARAESERDTDPDITIDLDVTKTYVRPPVGGWFAQLRMWAAHVLARMSWHLMP